MDEILAIAHEAGAAIVEDAAQGLVAGYKGRALGAIGELGCLSFHETKNIHCGEGGALIVNDPKLVERAEILREKGTNRANFMRGEVDKYTWVDIGSSYLPNELSAGFLLAQLESAEDITRQRKKIWQKYWEALANSGFELPDPPAECDHNAHIFWIKARNEAERDYFIEALRREGVQAPFHYVPLHSTGPGLSVGRFHGEDRVTTRDAGRLLRLPLYPSLGADEQQKVIETLLRLVREKRSH
jgi:dTDP-4-amino-4,6-dideoxygalactose transaminase